MGSESHRYGDVTQRLRQRGSRPADHSCGIERLMKTALLAEKGEILTA